MLTVMIKRFTSAASGLLANVDGYLEKLELGGSMEEERAGC